MCGFSFHNNNKKIFLSRRITTTTPPKNKKIPFSCAFVDIGDITNNCYSVERKRKKKKKTFSSDSFRSATRRRSIVCP